VPGLVAWPFAFHWGILISFLVQGRPCAKKVEAKHAANDIRLQPVCSMHDASAGQSHEPNDL
jgi:hypothetical protein